MKMLNIGVNGLVNINSKTGLQFLLSILLHVKQVNVLTMGEECGLIMAFSNNMIMFECSSFQETLGHFMD